MDIRYQNFARILVDYSAKIQPGDRVAIISSYPAVELIQELYSQILAARRFPTLVIGFTRPGRAVLRQRTPREPGLPFTFSEDGV